MRRKKPILVILAVFAGVMLLVVAAALIMRGRSAASFQNEDAPYPYRWTEKRNGTILLVLDNAGTENWTTKSVGDDVAVVSLAGNSSRGTAFLISPISDGRTELIFTLSENKELLAETALEVETLDQNGKIGVTVTHHSERTLQSVMNGGEETEHPFAARSDGYGGIVIHIDDSKISAQEEGQADAELLYPEPERWTAESSDSLIASVRMLQAVEGGIDVFLSSNINGSAEITVASEKANFAYVFTIVSENGSLRLTESQWSDYEQRATKAEDVMNELLTGITDTMGGLETERTP